MKRALILAAILAGVMGSLFVLPANRQTQSALDITIPKGIAGWEAFHEKPSQVELDTLAGDSEFAKARCHRRRSILFEAEGTDVVQLSIVLSGHDLANSIHRPERCMAAQGHYDMQVEPATLELADGKTVPLMRILSKKNWEPKGEGGPRIPCDFVTYYFFVGHEKITAKHLDRNLIDIADRVMKGEAQRWAFVMASTQFDPDAGPDALGLAGREEAKGHIKEMLGALAMTNVNWEQLKDY